MPQLFRNNARSTLVTALGSAGTSLEVNSLDAAKFPAPAAGDYFDLTLQDTTNIEIVRITARVGGVMTIGARALEGTTTPSTFAVGTVVGLRLTAAATEAAIGHAGTTTGAHAASAISNTPAGNISATTVQAALNELDAEKLSNGAGAVGTTNLADSGVTTAKIANDAVTYAKLQNVSATDRLLGRATAGAGDVEEIVCTSFARTLLDDADASTAQTTLGVSTYIKTLLDDADAATARATLGTTLAANAGGTADAITATFTPPITALSNGLPVLYVRAAAANTTTAPTFSPNGLTASFIAKGNNLPLAVGDIAGAGHWLELQYDSALDRWMLQNPATGISTASNGEFRSIRVFTASGTYTRPAGLVRAKITVVGGGGGGGSGSNGGGGGGGGGGAAIRIVDAATLGASQTVTVGAGGAASANGGTSSLGTLVSATGGGGGFSSSTNTGGLGGTGGAGASGNINIGGSDGAAGSLTDGVVYAYGGSGGNSLYGGGGGAGATGRVFGGGGGGGATGVAGVAGAAGVVIIEEFF